MRRCRLRPASTRITPNAATQIDPAKIGTSAGAAHGAKSHLPCNWLIMASERPTDSTTPTSKATAPPTSMAIDSLNTRSGYGRDACFDGHANEALRRSPKQLLEKLDDRAKCSHGGQRPHAHPGREFKRPPR